MIQGYPSIKCFHIQKNKKRISIGYLDTTLLVSIKFLDETSQINVCQGMINWKDLQSQFTKLFSKNCEEFYEFLAKQFNGQNIQITQHNLQWKPKNIKNINELKLTIPLQVFKKDQISLSTKIIQMSVFFFDSQRKREQNIVKLEAIQDQEIQKRTKEPMTRSKNKIPLKNQQSVDSKSKSKRPYIKGRTLKVQCNHIDSSKNSNEVCKKCYRQIYAKMIPKCGHPDRRHACGGRCSQCYKKHLTKKKKQASKKIKKKMEFQSSSKQKFSSQLQNDQNSNLNQESNVSIQEADQYIQEMN